MRKRKVTYPPARTATRQPRPAGIGGDPVRPNFVAIDMTVATGSRDFSIGDRVQITGNGLYTGETAVVESLVGGVIPSALVRTEAGMARRVRAVDLRPLRSDA